MAASSSLTPSSSSSPTSAKNLLEPYVIPNFFKEIFSEGKDAKAAEENFIANLAHHKKRVSEIPEELKQISNYLSKNEIKADDPIYPVYQKAKNIYEVALNNQTCELKTWKYHLFQIETADKQYQYFENVRIAIRDALKEAAIFALEQIIARKTFGDLSEFKQRFEFILELSEMIGTPPNRILKEEKRADNAKQYIKFKDSVSLYTLIINTNKIINKDPIGGENKIDILQKKLTSNFRKLQDNFQILIDPTIDPRPVIDPSEAFYFTKPEPKKAVKAALCCDGKPLTKEKLQTMLEHNQKKQADIRTKNKEFVEIVKPPYILLTGPELTLSDAKKAYSHLIILNDLKNRSDILANKKVTLSQPPAFLRTIALKNNFAEMKRTLDESKLNYTAGFPERIYKILAEAKDNCAVITTLEHQYNNIQTVIQSLEKKVADDTKVLANPDIDQKEFERISQVEVDFKALNAHEAKLISARTTVTSEKLLALETTNDAIKKEIQSEIIEMHKLFLKKMAEIKDSPEKIKIIEEEKLIYFGIDESISDDGPFLCKVKRNNLSNPGPIFAINQAYKTLHELRATLEKISALEPLPTITHITESKIPPSTTTTVTRRIGPTTTQASTALPSSPAAAALLTPKLNGGALPPQPTAENKTTEQKPQAKPKATSQSVLEFFVTPIACAFYLLQLAATSPAPSSDNLPTPTESKRTEPAQPKSTSQRLLGFFIEAAASALQLLGLATSLSIAANYSKEIRKKTDICASSNTSKLFIETDEINDAFDFKPKAAPKVASAVAVTKNTAPATSARGTTPTVPIGITVPRTNARPGQFSPPRQSRRIPIPSSAKGVARLRGVSSSYPR